ncbi:helix-turn-helix domain-containing protein [Consotaella salsifontis]|uniref:CRP/FNR family transcriptional regulator, transcriptional activator FtrB n=1 Tax=Consotaella salsifontis TaxID=1365950 RepID=A0A1T4Q0M7_9HYPH|nr:helix-turn-helix domain-containing protein [Consotaella salsifontis]SJZ97370.1 CRP/FNR family transcriptional regulator, transcriptional activator FtrB [Consotaella salsifontis]
MRQEDIDRVRALRLFRDVADETFETLLRASFLQRFPRGLTLIRESEPADFLHVVIEGAVEMFAAGNGRETTISLVHPIGAFILAAVLKDQVNLQSARTLEPSQILMIPAVSVRQAMERDPAFMSAIVAELATGYRTVVKDLKNQKLRTGAERLANWLLRQEKERGAGGKVEIDVEKRTLAALLGMTPENLSRALATLKQHGVAVRGAQIEINERDRLVRFAHPDPLIDDYDI